VSAATRGGATGGRRAALALFRRVRAGELADRAFDQVTAALAPRDRAWVHEATYGVLRLRGRLDAMLRPHVRGGIDRLEPDVLDVLRLGAYQLSQMHGVPPYAAVSQAVELARDAGAARAAGLVNGVLQSMLRAAPLPPPDPEQADVAALADWGSHPRWLVERWIERWGPRETMALLEAGNTRPELFLTPVGVTTEAARERLAARGIGSDPLPSFPDSLRIHPPAGAAEALDAAGGVVQDPASAAVVRYADIPPGARVIDLCAAPGGKAAALSARAGLVVAADLSRRRIQRVRENVRRLGANRVALVVADARRPPFRPVDAVLIDAPCTGTGTFRRNPDGRWRVLPEDLEALAVLQAEILEGGAACVRPGGLLVYSTCSLEPEENEIQVDRFLKRNPEFRIEPPGAALDAALIVDGMLSILPQRTGTDGAFAARLRRDG
jgi:16S rRNA (cytosine967-C5)-methyltransferase